MKTTFAISLRRSLAVMALLLAVLVVALASSPPPAQAQAQTEVWSATLTVRNLGFGNLGCANGVIEFPCSSTSNLSDDEFTHASTDYEITGLTLGSNGQLNIFVDTDIVTGSEKLILDVAGTEFVFGDADRRGDAVRGWSNSGLSWSVGDTIAVKLLEQTGVWSGTVTTGDLGGDPPQIGWAAGIGSLDDSTFDHGGSSYTIDRVSETSEFGSSSLAISLTSGGLDASDLTLHVDGEAFAFSAAFYNPGTATWFWTNTGLSWEAGDTVALSITQSGPPLVSNTGQAHDASVSINHSAAQQFSTDSDAAGYDLASVGYWIVTKSADSALTVTLRASVSGTPDVPGDVVHTFTSPTLVAGSLNVFTAPYGATLSADTDYFLVMEETAGAITMRGTASAAEDTGSQTGFSIADSRLWCSAACGSSGWNSASVNVLQIIVSSVPSATPPSAPTESPPPAQPQTQTEVWSATLTARDLGFGFLGCWNFVAVAFPCSSTSNLSDDDFTHASTDNEITGLFIQPIGLLQIDFLNNIATGIILRREAGI